MRNIVSHVPVQPLLRGLALVAPLVLLCMLALASPAAIEQKLIAADGAASDALGNSVAIDGDKIVAGALGGDIGANADQGSAYTFARSGAAARTETGKLTASAGAAGHELGFSVAIDGHTIVAGAPGDDVGANA